MCVWRERERERERERVLLTGDAVDALCLCEEVLLAPLGDELLGLPTVHQHALLHGSFHRRLGHLGDAGLHLK